MSANFFELMRYAKTGISSPEMTGYDKLKARAMFGGGGFPVNTLTGIPPISFKSDGTPLTAWDILANMVQDGTPSPGPVNPNLADPSETVPGYQESNGSIHIPSAAEEITTDFIPFTNTLYILISGSANGDMNYAAYNANKQIIGIYNTGFTPNTVITADPQNYTGAAYLRASWTHGVNQPICITTEQTSTFIPFDPDPPGPVIPWEFGDLVTTGEHAGQYKIPITNAGTTYNIFLTEPLRKIGDYGDTAASDGTVTRRIEKTVLDGTENWSSTEGTHAYFRLAISDYDEHVPDLIICTHTSYTNITTATTGFGCDLIISQPNNKDFLAFRLAGYTLESFKTFLADEYVAGHPVTVWYVLATATTETVTAPTITPARGSNTLTIGTTLPPSEVSITGRIKA